MDYWNRVFIIEEIKRYNKDQTNHDKSKRRRGYQILPKEVDLYEEKFEKINKER